MTTDMTEQKQAYVDGLRELADFLATHPEFINTYVPVTLYVFPSGDDNEMVQAETARLVQQLGGERKKSSSGGFFNVGRSFGPYCEVQVSVLHEQVCERVVVGVETVEAPDPAAVAALPKIRREVEKVEWRCPDSILQSA